MYKIFRILNCGCEIKWAMTFAVMMQFMQLRIEARKSQDFNGIWIRDLAIPKRRSKQLRYEATDVRRSLFNEPVRNDHAKWYIKYFLHHIHKEYLWIWSDIRIMEWMWIYMYVYSIYHFTSFQMNVKWCMKYFIYHFTFIPYGLIKLFLELRRL